MKVENTGVQQAIDSWYNNIQHDVIHVWDQDDTWFITIRHYSPADDKIKLDFVRLFPSHRMKDEYHLSIDNTVTV